MKPLKKILFIIAIIITFRSYSQATAQIVPQPNQIEVFENGTFTVSENTSIKKSDDSKTISKVLKTLFKEEFNIDVKIVSAKKSNQIQFAQDGSMAKEAYQLEVTTNEIKITAAGYSGWFYGVQSLDQLISSSKKIPILKIKDTPRFAWRAYMLDESRYFQGEQFVKKILDEMALLKMNTFHWHLTDDAGWRIEIKKYPKLTEVGSKRQDSEIETWGSGKTSGKPHSGFYTQKQIKDIVAYAKERNITIIPEFEMPGHSSAAIASYPWLGTLGKQIPVPAKFGRHYDNYDVTNPKVTQFVQDVLLELFELFPSKVIHIGGDEVDYTVWKKTKHVQDYMKEHKLNTPADLQIYFTNSISKFIESKGRRMMGWNEIMGINIHKDFEEKQNDKEAESSLAQNVVVHFWKGDISLISKAAAKGYDLVNSIHYNTYLDYSYKSIPLSKAYNFNPIPKGLDKKYHKNIYGLGCQMWTEWTPTNNDVEYQTFPRIAAYAEVGWTDLKNKDYASFKLRLEKLKVRWNGVNINYSKVVE